MKSDFTQIEWDAALAADCRQLVQLAMREDLGLPDGQDVTTAALVHSLAPALAQAPAQGRAAFVSREEIVVAGLPAAKMAAAEYGDAITFTPQVAEGDQVAKGTCIAEVRGQAAMLLSAERVMLNFLGRLCGIATQTRRYVDAVAGTSATIYDTRKTTPAWRRLEKYAVRCGGGKNHRTGLYDAVLIKDNHLAFGRAGTAGGAFTPALAVREAFEFIRNAGVAAIVEIEVDSLEQLETVLPEMPDIVLLDNMTAGTLSKAVAMRKRVAPGVQLEASGGITIDNVRAIALTGVDRISIGALTHAARWVDIGLDWRAV